MLLPIPLVLAAGKKIPRSFYFHTLARRSLQKKIDGLSQASKCCNNIRILKKFICNWPTHFLRVSSYLYPWLQVQRYEPGKFSHTPGPQMLLFVIHSSLSIERWETVLFRQCDKPSIPELTSSATSFSYYRKYSVMLSISSAPSQLPVTNSHDVICKFLERKSLYPWCVENIFSPFAFQGRSEESWSTASWFL